AATCRSVPPARTVSAGSLSRAANASSSRSGTRTVTGVEVGLPQRTVEFAHVTGWGRGVHVVGGRRAPAGRSGGGGCWGGAVGLDVGGGGFAGVLGGPDGRVAEVGAGLVGEPVEDVSGL